ncbi:hypothetical protein ACROYT_G029934 [Oculina patagonica]
MPRNKPRVRFLSQSNSTRSLLEQIESQSHHDQLSEDSLIKSAQQAVRSERLVKEFEDRAERIKEIAPQKTQRALNQASEKGSSTWLIFLPLQDLGFNLNNREFRDAFKLRYDWQVDDIPSTWSVTQNADSYKDLEPQQIYRRHEDEKKRLYSKRVLEIEHGTFTPLVFISTSGFGKECLWYHSRLAELIAIKKGER